MDYKEAVDELREFQSYYFNLGFHTIENQFKTAAEAIEGLLKERDELISKNEKIKEKEDLNNS